MSGPRLNVPSWFCPELTFDLQKVNITQQSRWQNYDPAKFHRDACFADYISFLVHLIFVTLTIFSLVLMSCYYRIKGLKHGRYTTRYPCHIARWLLCIPLFCIMLANITEGILSDMKLSDNTSSLNLYLTAVLASIAGLMAMVYYHNIEVWNQPSMAALLFMYWISALGCEIFRLYKWLDNPDHTDVRIMRFDCFILTVVIYSLFLLIECIAVLLQIYGCWRSHQEGPLASDLKKSNMHFYHNYANLFSASTFWWLHWLLTLGYKRPLEMSDLGCLPRRHCSRRNNRIFGRVLKEEKIKAMQEERDLGLYTVYARVHGGMHMLTFCIKFVADCLSFVGPVAVRGIVQYTTQHYYGTASDWDSMSDYVTVSEFFHNGFVLVIVMFLCASLRSLFLQNHQQIVAIEGIHLAAEVQGAVYEKSLSLSSWTMNGAGPMTIGQITNHMSTDALSLINFSEYLHYLWSVPFQISIIMWLLHVNLGASALVGASIFVLATPVQFVLAGMQAKIQKLALKVSDDRLKRTHELLLGMKLIKLCGWEDVFSKAISEVRKSEIARFTKGALIQAVMFFVINATPVFVTLVSFTLYSVWSNKPLTPDIAFSSLALVNQLSPPALLIPMVTMYVVTAHISTKRLQKFFMADELKSENRKVEEEGTRGMTDPKNGKLPDVEVKPSKQKETTHFSRLKDDDNNIPSAKEGSEAYGKEYMQLKPVSGDETVSDLPDLPESVALKIQEASFVWDPLQKDPILSNINLEIPKGQLTMIVGPVGAGKSSLLSAILGEMTKLHGNVQWNRMMSSVAYATQKAWLLNASLRDNILFGKEFDHKRFQSVVSACCLQPDIDILPAGDKTEIGEKGINLSGGQKQRVSVARAMYSQHQIVLLDDPFASLDVHVGSKLFHQGILGLLLDNHHTVILVTHQLQYLQYAHQVILMKNGQVARQGSMDDIWEADPELYTVWKQTSTVIQDIESTSEDEGVVEERRLLQRLVAEKRLEIAKEKEVTVDSGAVGKLIEIEERETGSVALKVFFHYGKAMGWPLVCLVAIFLVTQYAILMATDFWLSAWSEAGARLVNVTEEEINNISEHYIGGYTGLSFTAAFLSYVTCACLLLAGLMAAKKMHQAMLNNICHAPMRFFDTTPVGRILNRFSTDMNVIDKALSQSWHFFFRALYKSSAAIFVNAIVTPIFLAIIFPVVVGYIILQRFFLASSRELQRLESISRSPVYAKFSETLAGLATIRAYRYEEKFENSMLDCIDTYLTAAIYRATASRWLGIRLDFIGAMMLLLAGCTSLTVARLGNLEPSWVGIAIAYALASGMFLNYLIKHSTQVEMEMNAVERVKHYIHVPAEDYEGLTNPAPTWPHEGSITLDRVCARYASDLDPVLHEVSLHIQAGQKIGICGRTGSGKSSLALALFRLIQINKGKITIDGLDLTSVPLSTLRHRLSIIPQDPMLFTGTIRFNLDPEGSCSDEELWHSLEIAQLKTLVSNLEEGLDSQVTEGGENYSVGQRQLFCLARAFLRKTQILIMDEATASIDMETDAILQQVVATAFSDQTVLTIAHRVSSILNSDLILVLKDGHIAEYDTPENLLAKEDSVFASFVQANQ